MNLQRKVWRPPTDVYETDREIVVRVEIAGMDERDFNIELTRRTLVVSGRRLDQASAPKLAYQQMEIVYGDFRTEVYLPWPVNQATVEATYQAGFLVIALSKASAHRVPILNTGGSDEPGGASEPAAHAA